MTEGHRGRTSHVKMDYREAARDYGIGFACAFFMAATVAAYLIMWQQHVPDSVYNASVVFFVIVSFAGSILIVIAYLWPIRMYEFMEANGDG